MKKKFNLEEMFCGMPHLQSYFKTQENTIKRFGLNTENNPAIIVAKKRKELLLDTASSLTISDFKIIFYLNNLDFILKNEVLRSLKNLCTVRCDFEKLLKIENEKLSLMEDIKLEE